MFFSQKLFKDHLNYFIISGIVVLWLDTEYVGKAIASSNATVACLKYICSAD